IQANDLVGRKVARDGGNAAGELIKAIHETVADLAADDGGLDDLAAPLTSAVQALETATDWVVETWPQDPAPAAAGAVHYLRLMGIATGGWLLARGALRAAKRKAGGDTDSYLDHKVISARFFAEQYLPQAAALRATILGGGGTVAAVSPDAF
ncbi:MAG: acyl-CoA dehydrogenase C-terminal domain-containing protein, partial [Rhodospirillales bacterium]